MKFIDKDTFAKAIETSPVPPTFLSGLQPIHVAVDTGADDKTSVLFYTKGDGDKLNVCGIQTLSPKDFAFEVTNSSEPKPVPSISKGKFEVTGEITATFTNFDGIQKYLDEMKAAKEDMLDSFFGEHLKAGQYLVQCPPPAQHDITVPPFLAAELITPQSAMQAVFARLLVVSRKQRCAGYIMQHSDRIGGPARFSTYRTPVGSRCPFGYLIPDHFYTPDLEFNPASAPHVMQVMGLGRFIHDLDFRAFLDGAQAALHDGIPYSDRASFMLEFECNARIIAEKYNLTYFMQGDDEEPEWAR